MTLFSIIIPLYNKEKHIKHTLKSVLDQTCVDFEIIIVNDGSTDTSLEEVADIIDNRIKLFTIENQGVSNARNFGVSKAESEFIVLLDADDFWKPNHLESIKKLQKTFPHCGMYATAYGSVFGGKRISSVYNNIPKQSNWSGIIDDFFECSSINCIASSSSVMIPKNIYEDLGGFNSAYNSGEDTDFWIRIALNFEVAFTNEPSVLINMDAENQASKMSVNIRNYLNFNGFGEEKTNPSLKKYLDLNRFSVAIQHILAGNDVDAKELISQIDNRNLNSKQRFLLQMNAKNLKIMLKFKNSLRKNGIGLNAFR